MLRIIVRTTNAGTAANLGGPGTPIDVKYTTFDVDLPALETFLKEWEGNRNACIERQVMGVEILDETKFS